MPGERAYGAPWEPLPPADPPSGAPGDTGAAALPAGPDAAAAGGGEAPAGASARGETRASSRAGRGASNESGSEPSPPRGSSSSPEAGPSSPEAGTAPPGVCAAPGGLARPLRPASGMRVTATVPAPCRRRAASARPADRCACRGLRAHGQSPYLAARGRGGRGRDARQPEQPSLGPALRRRRARRLVCLQHTGVVCAPAHLPPRAACSAPRAVQPALRAEGAGRGDGETIVGLAADSGRRQPAVKP